MTTTPAELLERALDEIFNQQDAAARRTAIDELFAPEVVFIDPEGESTGVEAVTAKIDGLVRGLDSGFVFRSTALAQQAGELGIHRWALGPEHAAPVVTGTDIILVADGRIARFFTVVD